MDTLITLIILGAFIRKALKKSEGKKAKKTAKQSVPNQKRQSDRPVQRTTQAQHDTYYQQKKTKERLQKKYGLQQPSGKTDILSRAKENVQKAEPDTIQKEVHAEVCRDYRDTGHKAADVKIHRMQAVNCAAEEESDIIKRVNDLIVTGYSGDMKFDRDFIAEGIDMINRFSL